MKNKKIIGLVIAVLVIIGVMFGFNYGKKEKGNNYDKQITIVVENRLSEDTVVLYNKTVGTNATTLEEVLQEVAELKVVMTNGEWGVFIESMCDVAQEPESGAYWMFDSQNNAGCVANGYCDGASNVILADGDAFTFYIAAYLPQ